MPESRMLLVEFTPFRIADSIDWSPVIQEGTMESWGQWDPLIANLREWILDHTDDLKKSVPPVQAITPKGRRRFIPFDSLRCLEHGGDAQQSLDANSWLTECEFLSRSRMPVRLVYDASTHISTCREILNNARTWCVIHLAFWSDDGIQQYETAILDAVGRGVQVYLYLGLPNEDGAFQIPASLAKLAAATKTLEGEFFVNETATHSHAKFVAADDDTAFVSSFNFLGATEKNPQLNIGLLFRRAPHSPSTLVADVVHCLTARPIWDESISQLEQLVGATFAAPENIHAESESTLGQHSLTRLQAVIHDAQTPSVVWELVESAAHRDALLNALYSAKESVAIVSGDLNRSAVDSVLRGYLSDALARGVSVRLLWGCQAGEPGQREDAEALAAELATQWGETRLFQMNRKPLQVHAKVVVVDEWVSLVSSFNFLSYRGSRMGAHELGVKVFSAAVSQRLLRTVESYFRPHDSDQTSLSDERRRRLGSVVERVGQVEFRAALVSAYGGRCAITGSDAKQALEAAHLMPYLGPQSNDVSNGLLLRADIHSLFDLNLLGVDPDSHACVLAKILIGTSYKDLEGTRVVLPSDPADRPSNEALRYRWQLFLDETLQ